MKLTDLVTLFVDNISWDTDGENVNLPQSVTISELANKFSEALSYNSTTDDYDFDPEKIEIADYLSDKYGWCVNSCDFPILKKVTSHG